MPCNRHLLMYLAHAFIMSTVRVQGSFPLNSIVNIIYCIETV